MDINSCLWTYTVCRVEQASHIFGS